MIFEIKIQYQEVIAPPLPKVIQAAKTNEQTSK
jgi:hypothetical protein